MCGIAVTVCGIHIHSSELITTTEKYFPARLPHSFSVDDLKAALRRRGPDNFGTKKLILQSKQTTSASVEVEAEIAAFNGETSNEQIIVHDKNAPDSIAEFQFFGATLQLRGVNPISQPFVDSAGNILVYNGEIFGGISVSTDSNDGEVLMQTLANCCSVLEVLSSIKGPWAVIYWQNSSRTMWFGRDAFGRRSLLVHWPTEEDSRFLLSSVLPFSSVGDRSDGICYDFEVENGTNLKFWEELSCGIYSLTVDTSDLDGSLVGEIKRHEWADAMLVELVKWERVSVKPNPKMLHFSAQNILSALRKSVMLRTSIHKNFQAMRCKSRQDEFVPVAILFSGGLDSMILAALLDECLNSSYGIDLLNVSFDGQSAPDRITGKAGIKELRKISPFRKWKLVEIDADLSKLTWETKHVMSLINPADTYMDLNIGIALWLAASGDGWVYEESSNNNLEIQHRFRYKSNARIVLVGSGADEQCAGYGRHRTKYRSGSWHGLNEEMKLDMQRIWKRNMGRDDRCIADNGKEARFPFLDEDVIKTLLDIPLWEVANLDLPSGTGDKKILREVAQMLGLNEAAVLPKRAIQFGSRIARESNRKNFGSNRAANQASAGSVIINKP